MDTRSLMLRIKNGDRAAYAIIYRHYAPRLFGIAFRVLCDRGLAEDAAQEALLQVWTHSATFDPDKGHPTAWLLHLAHSRAVDRVRKVQSAQRVDQRYTDRESAVGTHPDDPCQQVIDRQDRDRVALLLDRLPPAQAQIITLAYLQEHTRPQIADRLGIPLGTVKWRSLRAVSVLSAVVRDEDAG